MNGPSAPRIRSPRWRWLVALVVLAGGPRPAWVEAQGLSVPAASLPAPPPTGDVPATAPRPGDLPPSSVAPAIERFARSAGLDTGVPRRPVAPAPRVPASRSASRPGLAAPAAVASGLGTVVSPRPDPADSLPPALPSQTPAAAAAAGADTTSGPRINVGQGLGIPAGSESRAAAGLSQLVASLRLKTAPFDSSDRRFPINLATALRLADARPLIVAAAQTSVWLAEAELTRAKILWVPTASFGADYIRHDGGGPDFNKGIMTAPSVNFFYAGPSLIQNVNLTDVIFQPLSARQTLNSRHYDVQTAKNDALWQTADSYFLVHQARGVYSGDLYCVELGKQLARRIGELSKDLITRVEIDRANNLLADLEQRANLHRQEWRVRSADLTQVLRLDPRAVVEPLERDHAQVTLVDPGRTFDDLMPVALANRPELSSRVALVQAQQYAVRREKSRPFLPVIQLNGFQSAANGLIQGGIFATGPNGSLNQFNGRVDESIQVVWQLEGFGIGNLARIKAQRGQESRTIIDLRRTQDRVAADVTRALARVQSGAARVLQADRALRSGLITYNGQVEGLGQTRRFGDVLTLTYRPQETIYALDLLNIAFNEYFTTVAEYNRAQFELFHALGYPARELAELRTPGAVQPVELARPNYLPRVGVGPPPATR